MNYSLLTPEILITILALGLLIIGLIVPNSQKSGVGYLATFGLIGILITTWVLRGNTGTLYKDMFVVDQFAIYFKLLFLISATLVSIISFDFVKKLEDHRSEFYVMMLFATLGMMVLASAGDFITLYVALELMTISFYVLTGFKHNDGKSAEAGIKYLFLGSLSSAILLYGLSLLYGMTQTTTLVEVAKILVNTPINFGLLVSLIFIVAGFGFKISLVPFHMWSPDIYEGAPTPVTAFLAVASKAAGFAVLIRVFIEAFPGYQNQWGLLLAVLAALSMIIGNLVAIPQTNIKRMLAFSSVAQAGYIVVGLVSATSLGIKAILFYAMIYVFANIGAFGVVVTTANAVGGDEIKDFNGLSQRAPLMASVMTISLLSMAGIPPLAGFVGKFYLFSEVINNGYLWIAFVGLVMSMMSVYYYLLVARAMFLGEPAETTPIPVPSSMKIVLIVSMLATILCGIYPAPLADMATVAAKVFFLN